MVGALTRARLKTITNEIIAIVRAYHTENPTIQGFAVSELPARFDGLESRVLEGAVQQLLKAKALVNTKGELHLPAFSPEGALSDADRAVTARIESAFKAGGLKPPSPLDVVTKNDEKLYRWLIREGVLVSAKVDARGQSTQNIVFHRDAIDDAKARLATTFQDGAAFKASDAKDVLGTSRKYLIPLLELLDRAQFTRRNGDMRTITGG